MHDLLAQSVWPNLYLVQHLPWVVFIFCFGACVGSFLNVVIYRLPAGMSVVTPPSRCPICGARLKFFGDNLPIIGWFLLRGKCRYCRVRISPQYMVIELLMALMFAGLYAMLFMRPSMLSWWPTWLLSGDDWWTLNQIPRVWPVFVAWVFLIAGLVAMTMIDARTFTIPIQVPTFVIITAFVAYPFQALWSLIVAPHRRAVDLWPIPVGGWTVNLMVFGAMLGLALSFILLKTGRIRYSFHDYDEYVQEGEILGDYPHARREMLVELAYLAPCLIGAVLGWFVGHQLAGSCPPVIVQALGGTFAGYLMGGGLIWAIRIFASLAFGKEAMGLGDVHLMGAVGAVLGWFDPILIFFLAPFSGIVWALLSKGFSTVLKKRWSELPYGPHLAIATLVVILFRPGLQAGWSVLFPGIPWPETKLCQAPVPAVSPGVTTPSTPAPAGHTQDPDPSAGP